MVERPGPSDLFGAIPQRRKSQRGWTELDRIRRRLQRLEARLSAGDYKDGDLDAIVELRQQIVERETEAREKWAKSFGK